MSRPRGSAVILNSSFDSRPGSFSWLRYVIGIPRCTLPIVCTHHHLRERVVSSHGGAPFFRASSSFLLLPVTTILLSFALLSSVVLSPNRARGSTNTLARRTGETGDAVGLQGETASPILLPSCIGDGSSWFSLIHATFCTRASCLNCNTVHTVLYTEDINLSLFKYRQMKVSFILWNVGVVFLLSCAK